MEQTLEVSSQNLLVSQKLSQRLSQKVRSVRRSVTQLFPGVVDAWKAGSLASNLVPRLVTEAAGTFILVLSATIEDSAPGSRAQYLAAQGQPFAVAATVTVIVMVGAPISGAHFNPALTLAFCVAGERTHADRPLLYTCTSIVAGIAAAALAFTLDGYNDGLPVLHPNPANGCVVEWVKVCVSEVLATLFFCSTVLYVAMLAKPPLGTFGPVLVGLSVFATIMGFRFVSGAIFNPAIGTALWVVGMANGKQQQRAASIVCFTLSDLFGGLLAGAAVRLGLWCAKPPAADFDEVPGLPQVTSNS